MERPKPIVYPQGDRVSDLEALNSVHDVQSGTIVVHLPPGNVPRQWVNYAILQALGHSYERIATAEKAGIHWSHWPVALEIERIVFYPAENLKPDLVRDLHSAAGPIEIWLANRRSAGTDWPGLEVHRGSLEDLRKVSKKRKVESDPVPGVNFMKTRWPSDPLKARFIALGFSTEEAGIFSNQFNETFRAAGHISKGKHLSDVALARMIRVLASNSRGEVCAGAYCGIWSRMFRQGRILANPEISVLRKSLPKVSLPNFHRLTSLDEPLVFGLVQSGFSLEEISAIRFDQAELIASGKVMIVGIEVLGDLADVLRCAVLRARSFHHDQNLVWSLLVQTTRKQRSKEEDRILELRTHYRAAADFFREQGVEYASQPKNLQTRKTVKLTGLVPKVPQCYVKSTLNERELSTLRDALEQTEWPDRFARNVTRPEDDLVRLVKGRYFERVDSRGVEVDQCVAMSQGFPMTKLAGELLERTHYEVRRANLIDTPPDPSRRRKDLRLIATVLGTEISESEVV